MDTDKPRQSIPTLTNQKDEESNRNLTKPMYIKPVNNRKKKNGKIIELRKYQETSFHLQCLSNKVQKKPK